MKRPLLVTASILLGAVIAGLYLVDPFSLSGRTGFEVTKVYFADNISEGHAKSIEIFNEQYRGRIEVIPVNLPFGKFTTNERKEILARSLRTKSDRIDVFAVDQIWVPRFAKWAEPLNDLITPVEQEGILSHALQSCWYDNGLVALPLYIDVGMLYYRRDIVRTLPNADAVERKLQASISWDEFIALGDQLGYRGKPFYVFQGDNYEGLMCNFFEIVRGMDAGALRGETLGLQTKAARAGLQFMVDLIHQERLTPPAVVEFDEQRSYRYLLDHDGVFVRGWPNFVESFRRTYGDTAKLSRIGRAALPHFRGEAPVSVFGGWNLMISKYSKKKDAALRFIRFLQTEEIQRLFFEVEGYLPIQEKVYRDSSYLREHPDLLYQRGLIERGFHRLSSEDYTKQSDIVSYFLKRALMRELTPEEALHRALNMIRSNETFLLR
jgi:multiple sugar transport system substrate-binding protein